MSAAPAPTAQRDTVSPQESSRRRAWASGVIAALFIALASALLPGAMPSSQMVGSAFNPATTQVALNRTDAEHDYAIAAPQEGARHVPDHGPSGVAVPVAFHLFAGSYFAPAIGSPRFPLHTDPSAATVLRPGLGPRAPPASFA